MACLTVTSIPLASHPFQFTFLYIYTNIYIYFFFLFYFRSATATLAAAANSIFNILHFDFAGAFLVIMWFWYFAQKHTQWKQSNGKGEDA